MKITLDSSKPKRLEKLISQEFNGINIHRQRFLNPSNPLLNPILMAWIPFINIYLACVGPPWPLLGADIFGLLLSVSSPVRKRATGLSVFPGACLTDPVAVRHIQRILHEC